ncbi:cytidylyltransferase domain-containing protein [Sphingobacterium puteale]|uniref:acylneuraminate cytidylyltransferase family protein n=1 Tax=Sphingobacterium puteale TaxID=2420510 RepID=UPI003D9994EC
MKNILISLCARGGSKGIPGKNIKLLDGKPLIHHSIQFAKSLEGEFNTFIELSTDDFDIKRVAESCGLKSMYNRPVFLATDSAGKVDAIRDLLNYAENKYNVRFDYVLDLDITSPLRTSEDVLKSFELMEKNPDALTLFSVNNASRNPYFNMVEKSPSGFYELSKKLDVSALSRQTAPAVYELNASFYFYRREFFDSNSNGVITNRSLIFLMEHVCFDLDHPIDFEFMDFLIKNNKLSFFPKNES